MPPFRTSSRRWTIDPANYAIGYDLALALLETGKLNERANRSSAC